MLMMAVDEKALFFNRDLYTVDFASTRTYKGRVEGSKHMGGDIGRAHNIARRLKEVWLFKAAVCEICCNL